MLLAQYETTFPYVLTEVFNTGASRTNTWSPRFASQGFAWWPGDVVFKLLEDDDVWHLEVHLGNIERVEPRPVRAIEVPFEVESAGSVSIGDYVTAFVVHIAPGQYALLFETGHLPDVAPQDDNDAPLGVSWVRLTFTPANDVEPRILVAESGFNPPETLVLNTAPPP